MTKMQTDTRAGVHSQAQVQDIAELEASHCDWRSVIGAMVLLAEDKTSLETVESVGYAQLVLATWQRFFQVRGCGYDAPVRIADAVRCTEPLWFETPSQPRPSLPRWALIEFLE